MLKQLSAVLDDANLSITLSKKEESYTLSIVPTSLKKDSKKLVNTPLLLTGTIEEIESNITEAVDALVSVSKSANNVAEFLANAKKETEGKKEKETTKANTTATPAPKKTEKKALTAEQKKAEKSYNDALAKAKTQKDIDVINFLENGVVKSYTDAKFTEDDIVSVKAQFQSVKDSLTGEKVETSEQTNDLFSSPEKPKETIDPEEKDDDDLVSTSDDEDDIF